MANLPSLTLKANKLWAIQLSDTEHRKWNNLENHSILVFNWEDIQVSGYSSQTDIFIAVAKKYSEHNNDKIKNIASGIYNFSRLRRGDGILGVDGERLVKKVGLIISKKNFPESDYRTELEIRWISKIKEISAETNIFKEDLEIQKISPRMLRQLQLPDEFSFDDEFLFYEELISTGDDDGEYIKKQISSLNLEPILEQKKISEKEEKGGKISLFYGTNRNKIDTNDVNEFYGDKLSELKYGKCEVSIPRGHVQGEVERPFEIFDIKIFSERERKHVVVKNIIEMKEEDFLSQLKKEINQFLEKSALIFIHGYNTTFAEAARRTAQIAWDIPFNGISGFYSWPSCGEKLSYLKDIEQADSSIPFLETFIEKIVEETEVERLHLIAHSMGNRLLTFTLNKLSSKASFSQKLKIIQQIVLAAPDIDQSVFKNTILPQFQNVGSRRTLYSSDKDEALHLSEELRRGLSRLGDAGDSLFVDNGLDTVDASNVKSGGNNHSYIFDTKELLSDLFYLLNYGFAPANRRLQARIKNTLTYWLFPK